MSGEAVATYEKTNTGKWILTVYHGAIPKNSANGHQPERMGEFVVPMECYLDGKPDLTMIATQFTPAKAGIRDDI